MKQPCPKHCPRRSPTCHGECRDYLEFYNGNRRQNEKDLQEQALDGLKIDGLRKAEKARRLTKGKILRRV